MAKNESQQSRNTQMDRSVSEKTLPFRQEPLNLMYFIWALPYRFSWLSGNIDNATSEISKKNSIPLVIHTTQIIWLRYKDMTHIIWLIRFDSYDSTLQIYNHYLNSFLNFESSKEDTLWSRPSSKIFSWSLAKEKNLELLVKSVEGLFDTKNKWSWISTSREIGWFCHECPTE